MKKIVAFFIVIGCSFSSNVFGQNYKSINYGYQIEIPKNYIIKEATGKNVDFNVADKLGNSIIIVVKKLPPEARNSSAYQMADISKEQWEQSLSEYLPNPKFVKSGKSKLDNKDAFWIHYTSQAGSEPKVIHINYMVFYKGLQYVITATCDQKDLDSNMPTFMRSIQSLVF